MKEYAAGLLTIIAVIVAISYFNPTGFITKEEINLDSSEILKEIIEQERSLEVVAEEPIEEIKLEPEAPETIEVEEQKSEPIIEEAIKNFCDEITCADSDAICPDGFKSTCKNTCDRETEFCSSCVPDCSAHGLPEPEAIEPEQEAINHIIFTQVYYYSPLNQKVEWIELFNTKDSSVNLADWSIHDNADKNTFVLPEIILQEKSYLVIVRNSEEFDILYDCSNYLDTGKSNSILNNGGDYLILKDDSGVEIDLVAWGGGYSESHPGWTIISDRNEVIKRENINSDTDSQDDWLSNQDPAPHC